ncbi:MAG: 3-hydroxybutyrate dehydrogenase [Treponema sp.]|nr:3-hydroxybutyrate dehydrogenase [Treponema sp.]
MSKVVFISGSADGIGKQVGEAFLKQGDKVVFSDINTEKLNALVNEWKGKGSECHGIKCDVTNNDEINAAIDETVSKYGRLDILVNNAGLQHVANVEDFTIEKFEFMIKMMTVAPFVAIKRTLPVMKKQNFGRIINMCSIQAVIGSPGKSGYNTAKHGLLGLTRVVALEAASFGITVNAVCPGYVDTALVQGQLEGLSKTRGVPVGEVLDKVLLPQIPLRRLLAVQEIVDYIMFLTSEKAGGITGQACLIDGGYTAQ